MIWQNKEENVTFVFALIMHSISTLSCSVLKSLKQGQDEEKKT